MSEGQPASADPEPFNIDCFDSSSTNLAYLMGPKALAENLFEYLAGPAFWQLGFRKLDAAWDLVIG